MFRKVKESLKLKKAYEVQYELNKAEAKRITIEKMNEYFKENPPHEEENGGYSFILTNKLKQIIINNYADIFLSDPVSFLDIYFNEFTEDGLSYGLMKYNGNHYSVYIRERNIDE